MARRTVPLTLLSALLLALALPNELHPGGQPLLGLFCLAPYFLALALAPSFAHAARLGLLFGASSALLSNYWLLFFDRFAAWTLGGVTLGYMGQQALLAPVLRGLSRLGHGLSRPGRPLPGDGVPVPGAGRALAGGGAASPPLLLAAGWTLYEYLKSGGFLGYPWGLIAYPAHGLAPLVQFVDLTGVWGLSFLMALFNALASEWLLIREQGFAGFRREAAGAAGTRRGGRELRGPAGFALALTALALLYGAWRLQAPIPFEKELRVLLVQPNVDPWSPGGALANIRDCQELTRRGLREGRAAPDLIVWSESTIRLPVVGNEAFFERNPAGDPLLPFVRETSTRLLSGAPLLVDGERGKAMNAALLFGPDGGVERSYGKQHPVPFAESLPIRELPAVRSLFRKVTGLESAWVTGGERTVFELPLRSGRSLSFAAPLCFEDSFAELCRRFIRDGAELWINLTNDSWSRTVSAETQHFVAARFRAIENRRVLIRSTNGGLTVVVGPKGEVLASLPPFRPGILSLRVPVHREARPTAYTAWGDWFPLLLAALLAAVLAVDAAGAGRAAAAPRRGRHPPRG